MEYTEFDRLGVADECLEGSQYSRYPANTNVLYIGLAASSCPDLWWSSRLCCGLKPPL